METDNSLSFSDQYSFQNTNLNELNYSNILYDENNMYITASNKNYYLFNSFLHKKRTIQNDNYNFVPQLYHKEHQGNYLFQNRFVILFSFSVLYTK